MIRLETIFENDDFIVINKPAGLFSIPDRIHSAESLKEILKKKYGDIFTVHRLDKGTSGLIVFARNEKTHQFLSKSFEERSVEKYYLGIVHGTLMAKSGTVKEPIAEHPSRNGRMVIFKRGKQAITDYEVLEEFGLYSLLRFRIHTGRTHQIRVHMQHLGHSIVCDEWYGQPDPIYLSSLKRNFKLSRNQDEERPIMHRLGLHASQLIFKDMNGTKNSFEAALPKDMKALLQQLRKWGGVRRLLNG
jgi:23S rRNA pseudouridine1911/1915/1917 synthase